MNRPALLNALTEYDCQQSTKKGYNPYALGQYLQALQNVGRYLEAGFPLRDAIVTCFLGRLCDKLLKAASLPLLTRDEAKYGLAKKLPELVES